MPFNDCTNQFSISRYIVDAAGGTPYTTVQSAIDAANAAGVDAEIYVRPGTYVENLTLYSGQVIKGATLETVISGNHTPPASGIFTFKNLYLLAGSGDIFSSAVAGTSILLVDNCYITVVNGYVFDIPSWAGGTLALVNSTDSSTNNGVINCTGGANALVSSSFAGRGTGNTLTFSNGNLDIISTRLACPSNIAGTGNLTINEGSSLLGSVTVGGTVVPTITNTKISTGANTSITHNSSNVMSLADVNIDTSNATAIGGTGTIDVGSITFIDSDVIAGTITQNRTPPRLHTGEIISENIENLTFSGFLEWDAAGPFYSVLGSTITILVAGSGYIKGRKVSWTAPQNTGGLASGSTYYIYMDETGTIGTTTTRTTALFKDNIVLLEALIDSSGVPNVIVVDEAHPYSFPVESSEWAHDTIGVVIANKNNGANITLNGTKGIQINGADELEDHGLETTIPDSGGAAVTFSFMYTNGAGKWVRNTTANTFPSDYNNAGVIAALGANKYGVFRLFISKDDINSATPTYYAVYDDQQYNNLTAANTAIALGTPATISTELAQLELAQLGFVVKEESSDTIVNVVIEKSTARSVTTGGASNQASLITTDTTNFDSWLSAADTNVQAALETLDDVGKGVTIDPGAAGDSYVQFDINTTGEFRIGVDDDAADAFKISQGSALGTNDTFIMTAAGERTMPLQPAFLAYLASTDLNKTGNGAQYVYGDTDVNTTLTEVFDQGGDFTPGASGGAVFTAPVTGRYLLTFASSCIGLTTPTQIQINIITSNRNYEYLNAVPGGAATSISGAYSTVADLDAADTVQYDIRVNGEAGNTGDIIGAADMRNAVSGCLLA